MRLVGGWFHRRAAPPQSLARNFHAATRKRGPSTESVTISVHLWLRFGPGRPTIRVHSDSFVSYSRGFVASGTCMQQFIAGVTSVKTPQMALTSSKPVQVRTSDSGIG